MRKYSLESLKGTLRRLRQEYRKPTILEHSWLKASNKTFLQIVGATFHQNRPDAMMVAREGYCNAFSELGYNVQIIDFTEIEKTIDNVQSPIAMYYLHQTLLFARYHISKSCIVYPLLFGCQ